MGDDERNAAKRVGEKLADLGDRLAATLDTQSSSAGDWIGNLVHQAWLFDAFASLPAIHRAIEVAVNLPLQPRTNSRFAATQTRRLHVQVFAAVFNLLHAAGRIRDGYAGEVDVCHYLAAQIREQGTRGGRAASPESAAEAIRSAKQSAFRVQADVDEKQAAEHLRLLAKLVRAGDWSPSDLKTTIDDAGTLLANIVNAAPSSPVARLIRGVFGHFTQFTIDGRIERMKSAGRVWREIRDSEAGKAEPAAPGMDRLVELGGLRDLTPSYCSLAASAFEQLADELIGEATAEVRAELVVAAAKGQASTNPTSETVGPTMSKAARGPTADVLMLAELTKNRTEVEGFTADQWAKRIGKAKSTIVGTETWKNLAMARQEVKVVRRADRSRRR